MKARSLLLAPVTAGLCLLAAWLASPRAVMAQADSTSAVPDSVALIGADAPVTAFHERGSEEPVIVLSDYPPAELGDDEIALLAAAAAELLPLLPHEPDAQPGASIDGFAIMGSVVDSVGGRGRLALSLAQGEAIVAALEERGLRARFCGAQCGGRFGDAAATLHLPRIEGDEATVWILTRWGIAHLPTLPPDRVAHRADELRLRRTDGGWELAEHTLLHERVDEIGGPGAPPTQ